MVQDGSKRFLRFGPQGGWQGALDLARPTRPVFPYQRAFSTLIQSIPTPHRFLSLGVGTGTALGTVAASHPDCTLYGLEIEQGVIDIATQFFDSPAHTDANYWIGDGVAFLCNVDLTFDCIFVDAYNANSIYSPCIDPAFVPVLHAALSENGVAVSNVIGHHPLQGPLRLFMHAAEAQFSEIALLPVGNPLLEQNMLIVFAKQCHVLDNWLETIAQAPLLHWLERISWPLRIHTIRGSLPVL